MDVDADERKSTSGVSSASPFELLALMLGKDSTSVLTSRPGPSAALTACLCEIHIPYPSYPVMLDEAGGWERHCKSVRHLYLVNLKVCGEQEAVFQEAQINSFLSGLWLKYKISALAVWNAAQRMWAAHQFACI